ncbi:MAG: acylphosphatase [Phycisphaeraceae bacterium]|nr:acylphosphatase [Phycisphaeraceae bacterium]
MSRQEHIRFRVTYSGRVQGVGFRATCRWIASSHPVTGWVRNEHDGNVTLEAQGSPAAVETFLQDIAGRLESNIASQSRMSLEVDPAETDFVIAR